MKTKAESVDFYPTKPKYAKLDGPLKTTIVIDNGAFGLPSVGNFIADKKAIVFSDGETWSRK